jgi:hypothetical protein
MQLLHRGRRVVCAIELADDPHDARPFEDDRNRVAHESVIVDEKDRRSPIDRLLLRRRLLQRPLLLLAVWVGRWLRVRHGGDSSSGGAA